jgi:hypothetical protein
LVQVIHSELLCSLQLKRSHPVLANEVTEVLADLVVAGGNVAGIRVLDNNIGLEVVEFVKAGMALTKSMKRLKVNNIRW